ncbi:hypothetical protein ES706_03724 [subsurface metagenome]
MDERGGLKTICSIIRGNLKAICLIIIVAVCASGVGLAWYYSGGPLPAEFVVENLEITPEVVYPGEEVTIPVDIANIGGTAGSNLVKLEVGGEILGSETVALDPGETKRVSFTVVVGEPGSYSVCIGDLTGSYEVVPLPVAEFVVENLEINPEVAELGEEVSILVDVANIGDAEGTYTVKLEVGGEAAGAENVTLGPSKTQTVSFTISKDVAGEYSVRVDGLLGSFEVWVAEPAEFTVENLSINPETVGAGEPVTISFDIANIGSTAGSKLVRLQIDGAVADSKSVVLNPSESKSVSFTVSKTVAGIYSVSVDGLTGSFEVTGEAEFELTNLGISPEEVEPGEEVTISVGVANIGAAQGTYIVKLKIKGIMVDSESVTLNPGDTQAVSFTVSRDDPSTYAVSVDGLTGSFTVVGGEMWGIITDYEAGGKVAIYHWWTAGGERHAFDTTTDVLHDQYPNIDIIPTAVAGGAGGAMVTKIKTEIIGGNPPETFQCHPGYELYPYYEAEALRNLDDLWEYEGLGERVPEVLSDICSVGGNYYIAPIGVHRTNVVWYNKQVFADCGVEPPSDPVTFEEFWFLCDELQSKLPEGKYPLVLADREDWPATHIFETIMMGTNPQTYEDFVNGTVTAEQLAPVLEQFKKYISYVDPSHRSWTWGEGCGKLLAGDRAMYLHGDWIKGYFTTRGWTCGNQYGCFTAPGTSDWFGLCVDGFVAANNSECPNNALRWLHSYVTVDAQEGFNPIKGSVSPYEDVPLDIYDDYSRGCAEDLYDPSTNFYPSIAHGSGSPWEVIYNLHRTVANFAVGPDVGGYANIIANLVQGVDHPMTWDIV